MKLKCERTKLNSGETTIEYHRAIIQHSNSGVGWCIYLKPGVTGYESFLMSDWFYRIDKEEGWCACAGTPDSWDKLVVPKEEMERLRDILELLPV